MKKEKLLEVFYHDTVIHDIRISQNKRTSEQEIFFVLENDEYGKIKCFIPSMILINMNYNLNQIGCHQILAIEVNIEPNELVSNYIKWSKKVLDIAQIRSFRLSTSSGSVIDFFMQSDDILIEKLWVPSNIYKYVLTLLKK